MKRKALIAVAIVGALLLVAGGSVGVRQTVGSSAACQKPLIFFDSDTPPAIAATDAYIDENIAELYEHPSTVNWVTADATVKPGSIKARIALGETESGFFGYSFVGGPPRQYIVELVKECAGGEWEVVKFELAKGEPPEPNSGQAPRPSSPA